MRRRLVGTFGVWLLAWAVLAAADFWEDKDYRSWSAKEVDKMLTDSPWSREVTVVIGEEDGGTLGRGAGPVVNEDLVRRAVSDSYRISDGYGVLGGRTGLLSSVPERVTLTVSWRSALPVKQALARAQAGIGFPIAPEQRAFLIQHEPLYVVSVSGIPRQFAEGVNREALLAGTSLNREDHDPIVAEDVEPFVDDDETVILEFAFLRDDPIRLIDGDVVFVMQLRETEIRRSFALQEMMFGDALAM